MALETLIFDVDGTLAETEEVHRLTFNAAFDEFGLGWRWDRPLYKDLLRVTGGRARIKHHWRRIDPAAAPDDDFIARLHTHKTALFQARLHSGAVPLRPGVERLLREARSAGLGLAIATTTSAGNVEALIAATMGPQAVAWFSVIGAGDVVANRKPAPDVFQYVVDRLGHPASACLAIEDSRNGLVSSLGAGVQAVITVNPYTADEDFPEALAVLSHLGEPAHPCRVLRGPALGKGPFAGIAFARLLWYAFRRARLRGARV